MSNRDSRLNSHAEMLVRLVYVSRFPLCLAGLVQAALCLQYASLYDLLKMVVSFAAALSGHLWLARGGRLTACNEALDCMCSRDPAETRDDELETLLEKRADLEAHRGEPGFDPWAVQSVRREINDYLRTHPQSTRRLD